MANPEHLEKLAQGVESFNEWKRVNYKIVMDLSRTSFVGAKLAKVDLRKTYLQEANFSGADLRQADLSGADLSFVDFSYADLREADLCDAFLPRAIFSGAKVSGALFHNAFIESTVFTEMELHEAVWLEEAVHNGPSEISISTIYRSEGKIPDAFLRGCGVPEDFITYMRSLTVTALDFYSCFISYSHADKSFAHRLHDALQGRGIRCWLDEHQMLPGDDIFEQIDTGIKLWDKVLLCCSKDSLTSWWVDNEVNTAFEKEQQLMKQRGRKSLALIPLNIDGYMFGGDWKSGKASQVKSRLAADFTGWETDNQKFEQQFELLVKALRADAGGRDTPPVPKI